MKRMVIRNEPILADCPERYRQIFGDCQFGLESVRKLLSAIVLVAVKVDWLTDVEAIEDPGERARAAAAKLEAERYIFDPSWPAGEPLSFSNICKVLDVDPDYARRGIRSRKPEDLVGIVQKLKRRRVADALRV